VNGLTFEDLVWARCAAHAEARVVQRTLDLLGEYCPAEHRERMQADIAQHNERAERFHEAGLDLLRAERTHG